MTFDALFVPEAIRDAVADAAWLDGMLDAERALANAEALAGVVPAHVATAIAEACRAELFDVEELASQGRAVGNPAEPLVRALREHVVGEAAGIVHFGATSQDVVDTAAMLVARAARGLILDELGGVVAACAGLAEAHRSTPIAARTLLQQAVPTTFGLKAAGWLVAVVDARRNLAAVRLPAQLGGAAGTLALLGDAGPEVLRLFAAELDLAEPVLPWHSHRGRVAELGAALAVAAGAVAKIALDVTLLAQTEVGEVREPAGGVSSTMPQKRNPVGSTLARACARLAAAHAGVLVTGLEHEHERAAGAWQAEWPALSGALAYTGGAAAAIRGALEGLEVDAERMRRNLDDWAMAERVASRLAEQLGREQARELVAELAQRGLSLREALRGEPRAGLTAEEIDTLLDPDGYLGSAGAFVDRALALYEENAG
jgi:3-carboxy-cis,cis-muconate cycloisomerase